MLTANTTGQVRIMAREAKKNTEYFCPACNKALVFKQGAIMVWHFAHKYLGDCWWPNESEEHHLFKEKLYDYYISLGYKCRLEKITEDRKSIIDLEVVDKEYHKIAIEIQLSNYTFDKLVKKTRNLTNSGYYTLWLFGGEAIRLIYSKEDDSFSEDSDWTTDGMYLSHSKFYFGRVYTITRNFMRRVDSEVDPDMEISALYLEYQTKKIISKRKYFPIKDFNLLCIENNGFKLARFYDKHYKKDEL